MTNDPKQAKTILGWLPQSPLSPSPAAQPAAGNSSAPATAQPGYPQAGYPHAGAQVQPPHAQGFPPQAPSPSVPGAQPSYGAFGAPQAAPGGPGAQPSYDAYGAQQSPGFPGAQPPHGYPQAAPGFPGAQPPQGSYSAQPPQGSYGAQHSAGYPGAQQAAGFPGAQQAAGFFGAQQPASFPGAQQAAGFFGAQQSAGAQQSESAASQGSLRDHANATEGVSDRTRFIRLTYLHLLGAILAFAGLEYLLMTNSFLIEKVSAPFVRFAIGGRWNWGVVLAVFMAVSWVADYWARHTTSRSLQYVGLGAYVVAEAVIFVPLLAIVQWKTAAIIARGGGDPNIIRDAAFTTLAIFGALTASVFITKKDFSFLRTGLMMASAAAMMLVILSLVFGFNLGIVFSIAMVLLAAGYILFQTSQILAHYDPRNHVAAALALFSSVALMFWYVIRIFMRMRE